MALQLLGRMLDHTLTARHQHATIVGATSGDTGSAAIEAVRDRKTIDVFMLFPRGRVSEVQRRQMTTVLAPNVHNVAIEGTFDDCQDLAKACFNDLAFRDRHALTAVNSINFARVMAQIVYYFWAAVKLGAPERPVAFTVPTGNFGNVYAGYAARQMGLPVSHFVVATNSNDILARFFETGAMTMTDVVPTYSPSMDIQISSNFERLLFDLYGRDGKALAEAMAGFRSSGTLKVGANALGGVRELFDAGRLDDEGTLEGHRRLPQALRRDARYPYRGGLCRGPAASARRQGADDRAVDGASRQVPGCGAEGCGRTAGAAAPARRPDGPHRARRRTAQRRGRAEGPDRRAHGGAAATSCGKAIGQR